MRRDPEREDMRDHEDEKEDLEPSKPPPHVFVRSALVFYGVMGCIALFWRMAASGESILHPSPAEAARAMDTLSSIAVGAVFGGLAVGLSELLTRWSDAGRALADTLGRSLAGIGRGDALLLALASGIAEEMLFRGALQPAVGLVWASLIFGACHFLPRRELFVWSLFAAAMGFLLGWLFEWTGQLAAPIAAHAVVNGINLPRLARRFESSGD